MARMIFGRGGEEPKVEETVGKRHARDASRKDRFLNMG